MRQSCATVRAAGGSFCRTGRGCHVDRRAGQGARDLATLLARTGTAAADWDGPLNAGAALRLACDATISPALTAGPSEGLDLGRSVRCAWPGCVRPPAFTDGHPFRHSIDGGATELDNLALVCRRHHRLVHAGWELAHRPDGIWSCLLYTSDAADDLL